MEFKSAMRMFLTVLILHISRLHQLQGSTLKVYEKIVLTRTSYVRFEENADVNTLSLHGKAGLRASLRAFGRKFHIRAARRSVPPPVLSPQVQINLVNVGEHGIRRFGYDQLRYYVGKVVDVFDSSFSCSVSDDGRLSYGVIIVEDEMFYLEPAGRYHPDAGYNEIILYPSNQELSQNCSFSHLRLWRDGKQGPSISRTRTKRQVDTFYNHLEEWHLKNRLCGLHLVADHTLLEYSSNSIKSVIDLMMVSVGRVSDIFAMTDFTGNGIPEGLHLQIQEITLLNASKTLKNEDISVDELLEEFSRFIGRQTIHHCLAVCFTARDFRPALDTGLAYLANSNVNGPSGGICEVVVDEKGLGPISRNTVVMTTMSGDQMHPLSMNIAVLARLIGHSFGATNDDRQCHDGDQHYIMHPFTNVPTNPTNLKFSPCSIEKILPVLRNRGWCLKRKSEFGFCGDAIIQGEEECDCGMTAEECAFVDPCCTPADQGERSCHVRHQLGYTCSPFSSRCCDSQTCKSLDRGHFCAPPGEPCVKYATCNGQDHKCPLMGKRPDGTLCAGRTVTCLNGFCNASLCVLNNFEDCECLFPVSSRCKVCCRRKSDNICRPLNKLTSSQLVYHLPGSSCMNSMGFCNHKHVCLSLKKKIAYDGKEGPIKTPLSPISMWMATYFPYIFLAFVFLIVIFFIIQGLIQLYLMSSSILPFYKAVSMGTSRIWAYQSHKRYPSVFQVTAGRLLALFPSIPLQEVLAVACRYTRESAMVKLLLGRGYPMRTAFYTHEVINEFEKAPRPI